MDKRQEVPTIIIRDPEAKVALLWLNHAFVGEAYALRNVHAGTLKALEPEAIQKIVSAGLDLLAVQASETNVFCYRAKPNVTEVKPIPLAAWKASLGVEKISIRHKEICSYLVQSRETTKSSNIAEMALFFLLHTCNTTMPSVNQPKNPFLSLTCGSCGVLTVDEWKSYMLDPLFRYFWRILTPRLAKALVQTDINISEQINHATISQLCAPLLETRKNLFQAASDTWDLEFLHPFALALYQQKDWAKVPVLQAGGKLEDRITARESSATLLDAAIRMGALLLALKATSIADTNINLAREFIRSWLQLTDVIADAKTTKQKRRELT